MSTRAAGWSRSRRGWSKTPSLPNILLDCELFRQCRRVRAGLTVDGDHQMLDVVADVGPGGHFLKAKQTRQHMCSGELYMPQLMLREPYDAWSIAKHGALERAVAAVSRRSSPAPGPSLCRPVPPTGWTRSSPRPGASSAGGSGLIGEAVLSGPRPEGPRRGPD